MTLEKFFLWVGLIALPFIFGIKAESEAIREPKLQFMLLLVGCHLGLKIAQKINAALGVGVFSLFVSCYYSNIFIQPVSLIYSLAAFGTVFWTQNLSNKDIRLGAFLLEITAVISCIYGLIQVAGFDPIFTPFDFADKWRPTAFFGQHTLYGAFIVTALACAFFREHWSKWFSCAALFCQILMIDASFTYLSAAVVTGCWFLYTFRMRFVYTLCLLALLSPMVIAAMRERDMLNDKGRFLLWDQVLFLAKKRPIKGYGFGSFQVIYPTFQDAGMRKKEGIIDADLSDTAKSFITTAEGLRKDSGTFYSAHNEPLQAFFEGGLIAVFIMLWMAVSVAVSFYFSPQSPYDWTLMAIVLALFANSLGSLTFHLVPQGLFFLWAYVAMTSRNPAAIIFEYAKSRSKRAFSI